MKVEMKCAEKEGVQGLETIVIEETEYSGPDITLKIGDSKITVDADKLIEVIKFVRSTR